MRETTDNILPQRRQTRREVGNTESGKAVHNAAWIVACKVIQAVLGLVVTMLSARFLGPSGYGLITYAASVVAFVAPIMYLGFTSVLVQELIAHPEREGETLGTAIFSGLISGTLCIGGACAFVAVANRTKEAVIVCALYSTILIFQSLEMIVYWFQARLLSKYTSLISLAAYVAFSAYRIYLLAAQKSIYWFAVSGALDYLLISVAALIAYRRLGGRRLSFSRAVFSEMFAKSRYYIISDLMVTVFAQTDRIMINLMLGDAETGFYSAALNCAAMTGFVFTAVIDSFRPLIFGNRLRDDAAFRTNMKRLYSVVIWLSLLQSAFITVFAGLIVRILYGAAYSPSILTLRIAVWYTTFSYLGAVRNIWLLAEKKQKYLLPVNAAGALANVILNSLLIPSMGINGAALATLVTQFFTNVAVGFIIPAVRENNRIMLESLPPRLFLGICGSVIRNIFRRKSRAGAADEHISDADVR